MSENFLRDFLAKIVKIDQRKMSYALFGELAGRSYAEFLGKMYGGEFSGGDLSVENMQENAGEFSWENFQGERRHRTRRPTHYKIQ